MSKLTPEERAATLAAYEATGRNKTQTARLLGIHRCTLKTRLDMLESNEASVDQEQITQAREILALKDRIRGLENEIQSIHREENTAKNIREAIFGLKQQELKPPTWTLGSKKAGSEGAPVLCLSDFHWGEVVDPAQVNGINQYNLTIARKRLQTVIERTIHLCINHSTNPEYPGIVVAMLGDMISGSIHDELIETNELPIMPVIKDLVENLIEALSQLADAFGNVYVIGVCGNHGRNTTKPRLKYMNYTNFDWLIYQWLESAFTKDKRIKFNIPEGPDCYISIMGHRFLFTHGNNLGTRGGDGIIGILGPVIRGDFKVRDSSAAVGEPYDTLVIGHYHYLYGFDRIIVNGTLKGWDEYAKVQLRARPQPPQQALIKVHPEIGVHQYTPIFAEPPRRITDKAFVSVVE